MCADHPRTTSRKFKSRGKVQRRRVTTFRRKLLLSNISADGIYSICNQRNPGKMDRMISYSKQILHFSCAQAQYLTNREVNHEIIFVIFLVKAQQIFTNHLSSLILRLISWSPDTLPETKLKFVPQKCNTPDIFI